MTGRSKTAYGSDLDCSKTHKEVAKREPWRDLQLGSQRFFENKKDKLRCLLQKVLPFFLEEICGTSCFLRSLPPMLGTGQAVDLFKLCLLVSTHGGYETVCKNDLWDSVARECGLGVDAPVKLIYIKYLGAFENWMQRTVEDSKSGYKYSVSDLSIISMDVRPIIEAFLSELSDRKKDDGLFFVDLKKTELQSKGIEILGNDEEARTFENINVLEDREVNSIAVEDNMVLVSDKVGEDCCRKRKRGYYSKMLNWITDIAKDPCDPAVGSLPHRSTWKQSGSEQLWKQVLLAREAMLSKGSIDLNVQHTVWQKKQKMHPTMYDDQAGFERLRYSQRLVKAKESRILFASRKSDTNLCSELSSSGNSDSEDRMESFVSDSLVAMLGNRRQKRVPLGPNFQAVVPEWTGEISDSDSKWSGTKIWPKTVPSRYLIERVPIGTGREECCGCTLKGSRECVGFHISEKRTRLKAELTSVFYLWKFDKMGEEVAVSWRKDEEKKFQEVVKSSSASMDQCFWVDMVKCFPQKSKQELVSYYFNVFLLRRRGYQNRSTPDEIDSDDDESELASIVQGTCQEAVKSSGSIFCSPKKLHLNIG